MTAHTPSKEQPVATSTDSNDKHESDDHDGSADGEQPSLDDLADDELIRCQNPNYKFLTWFYELDDDGSVLTYHQLDDFVENAGMNQIDAERSIAADEVNTTVVDRDVLERRQQATRGGD